jgi:hypothetical protein
MRRLLAALSLAFLLPLVVRADEVTDLRDRILKAAAKNPADIQKFKGFTQKCKGTSRFGADPVPATMSRTGVYPDKLREDWEFGEGPDKTGLAVCVAGDNGWRKAKGAETYDLPIDELNELRADAYAVWASTLVTLTDADTKLSLAGRSKVGDDPVVGLKVSRRPYPDLTLFFDEKTYLLRKLEYRSRGGGIVLQKEMFFSGHKDVGGLMLPTRLITAAQGKEMCNWTEVEYGFPDVIEKKEFQKP